jgi:predicted nuclease with TOPRIM domain
VEKMTVDMGAELSGWAGRSDYDMRWEIEKEMAHRRTTDIEEELKDLKKAQEELVFENKQLIEQIKKYKQATTDLKEGMQDVNISNARLLYTNRVLRNTSLNERQKDKIAEAISNAGSVMEAKTIYETLESATPAQTIRAPQSLSEAINRPSSIIRASRKESTKPTDPFMDRMKKLAGIN